HAHDPLRQRQKRSRRSGGVAVHVKVDHFVHQEVDHPPPDEQRKQKLTLDDWMAVEVNASH
ncbi:MAG: hypothetical protein AAB308_04565, partial [Nitrospirota bacterium]